MAELSVPSSASFRSSPFVYQVASSASERAAAISVMRAVFVDELGYADMQGDQFDASATFFVALQEGQAIASIRLIVDGPLGLPLDQRADLSSLRHSKERLGEVSRLACLPEHRDRRVVAAGLGFVLATARHLGVTRLVLEALLHMAPLYERIGFVRQGGPFFDNTCVRRGESGMAPNSVLMTAELDALREL